MKVSYKTAKLARLCGFNEPTDYHYDIKGDLQVDMTYQRNEDHSAWVSAPEQSDLQEWLRTEVAPLGLYVWVKMSPYSSNFDSWVWELREIENGRVRQFSQQDQINDPFEVALEKGLLKALSLLQIWYKSNE